MLFSGFGGGTLGWGEKHEDRQRFRDVVEQVADARRHEDDRSERNIEGFAIAV